MPTEDAAHEPARAPLAAAKQDHRRALGSLGEDLAAAHLLRRGFRVLDRNVRTRHGEIDMIACDERVLAFVEVKTLRARPGAAEPQPLAGLGWAQRKRLRRLAGAWLAREQARPRVQTLRFDAIGVVLDERGRLLRLDHLEGAW
ncbi:MAG: YraN family protein [Solirubrobacterales bacterium]|nr:YraN family protein [Solirubrobacterales bacterium]